MAGSYKAMMGNAALWCLVLWQTAGCASLQAAECQQLTSPCLFHCTVPGSNSSWWLDLTSLQPETEMQPVFKNILDKNGMYSYSYSPCTEYSQGSGCSKGTSVCQVDPLDLKHTNDVGDMSTAVLTYDPNSGQASLIYRKPLTGELTKISQVNLLCAEKEKTTQLTVEGEVLTDNYVMNLTGPAACLSTSSPTTHLPTSTAHSPTTEPTHPTTEPRDVTTSQSNGTHGTTHGHEVTTQEESTPADVTTSGRVTTHHTTGSTTGETTSMEVVTTASHGTEATTGVSTSTRHPTSTASCRLGLSVLFLLLAAKLALSII